MAENQHLEIPAQMGGEPADVLFVHAAEVRRAAPAGSAVGQFPGRVKA
jgi:hypothetical protein